MNVYLLFWYLQQNLYFYKNKTSHFVMFSILLSLGCSRFEEENLLTESSRRRWEQWRAKAGEGLAARRGRQAETAGATPPAAAVPVPA